MRPTAITQAVKYLCWSIYMDYQHRLQLAKDIEIQELKHLANEQWAELEKRSYP